MKITQHARRLLESSDHGARLNRGMLTVSRSLPHAPCVSGSRSTDWLRENLQRKAVIKLLLLFGTGVTSSKCVRFKTVSLSFCLLICWVFFSEIFCSSDMSVHVCFFFVFFFCGSKRKLFFSFFFSFSFFKALLLLLLIAFISIAPFFALRQTQCARHVSYCS